jgi:predicted deacylase
MPPLRRVDAANAAQGLRAVRNALRSMGMVSGDLERPPRTVVFGTKPQQGQTIRAEREGFMSRHATPGDAVTKGQLLAEILSPEDFAVVQEIRSPLDGFLVSLGRPPQIWGDPEHDFMNVEDSAASVSTASDVIKW